MAKTTKIHADRMRRAIDREDTQMAAFTVLINEESARAEHAEHNMQQELERVNASITSSMHHVAIGACLGTCAERQLKTLWGPALSVHANLSWQALISLLLLTGDGSNEAD